MPVFAQVTFEVQSQWIFYGSLLALVTGILILIFHASSTTSSPSI